MNNEDYPKYKQIIYELDTELRVLLLRGVLSISKTQDDIPQLIITSSSEPIYTFYDFINDKDVNYVARINNAIDLDDQYRINNYVMQYISRVMEEENSLNTLIQLSLKVHYIYLYGPAFIDLNDPKNKPLCASALQEASDKKLLGSIGDQEAASLVCKLRNEDYCLRHNITYNQLNEFDYENMAYEQSQSDEDLSLY